MDLKQIFGAILTLLGTVSLIYAAYAFMSGGGSIGKLQVSQFNALVPFIIGLIFFFSGIALIKRTPNHR